MSRRRESALSSQGSEEIQDDGDEFVRAYAKYVSCHGGEWKWRRSPLCRRRVHAIGSSVVLPTVEEAPFPIQLGFICRKAEEKTDLEAENAKLKELSGRGARFG